MVVIMMITFAIGSIIQILQTLKLYRLYKERASDMRKMRERK